MIAIPLEALDSFPHRDAAARPSEATETHTRLLRIALAIEESRAYWRAVDLDGSPAERVIDAAAQDWFGGKSEERVRFLIQVFVERYDAIPDALRALKALPALEPDAARVICHLHLQFADPLYRRFTGERLPALRAQPGATVDRDDVIRWVEAAYPGRWSQATVVQFASKLLSAASEAGLVSPKRDPRSLILPPVPELALEYALYLLRDASFEGTLVDNRYFASLGLAGDRLEKRARALAYPSLAAWADSKR